MKCILIFLAVAIFCACSEDDRIVHPDEIDIICTDKERCNGNIVEEYSCGKWVKVIDCQKYVVASSGAVCPRKCCQIDTWAECRPKCPDEDGGTE